MDGPTVVQANGTLRLADLDPAPIRETFAAKGVLLFRGFAVTPAELKDFAHRFSVRFNRDQSRPAVDGDGYVYLVTEGDAYVAPHSEQANSPFRPDAIWFACAVPADAGGRTLVWDGVEFWSELPPSMRELFSTRRIRFFQRYPADRWRQFVGPDATIEEATRMLDASPGTSYFVRSDGSIYLEYVTSAAVRTRYGGLTAFANSLMLEYRTLRTAGGESAGSSLSFEDGSPVTDEIVATLEKVAVGLAQPIEWEAGDVAMIDNSRFMHGREAFKDNNRQLFSCCSFLNF